MGIERLTTRRLALSVLAPARDEAVHLPALVDEITAALDPLELEYEIVIADDASRDATADVLWDLAADHPRLRFLRLDAPAEGAGNGPSAALHAALRASRGALVATLDANLGDDPADVARLVEVQRKTGADLVQGHRRGAAGVALATRLCDAIERRLRARLLGESSPGARASLRVMRREAALALPL